METGANWRIFEIIGALRLCKRLATQEPSTVCGFSKKTHNKKPLKQLLSGNSGYCIHRFEPLRTHLTSNSRRIRTQTIISTGKPKSKTRQNTAREFHIFRVYYLQLIWKLKIKFSTKRNKTPVDENIGNLLLKKKQ